MAEINEILFRPTLIICLGEAGTLIREYLSPYYGEVERQLQSPPSRYHLLSNLDKPLRDSVGLLQVDKDIATPFPIMSEFTTDPEIPVQAGHLRKIIYQALVSVQLDRRLLAISSANYTVSNTRTQIFIVGEPGQDNKIWMKKVLGIVRDLVRSFHFETPVCYFLNDYGSEDDYLSTLKRSLTAKDNWRNFELANFSYLYEHMISYPSPVFVTQNEVRYATAQAILGLAATGITSTTMFEEEMKLPLNLEDYADRIGNLSTSMILFPHAGARFYCGALLTSDLMKKWLGDLFKGLLPDRQREQVSDEARMMVDNIEDWLADRIPRPNAEESLWPSFRILRRKDHPESERLGYVQRDAYRDLVDQTAKLFETFSADIITDEYNARLDRSETWVDIAYDHCNKAEGLFNIWEQHARITWDALRDRIGTELRHEVDRRWPEAKNGFEVAKVYIDQMDNQLADLLNQVSRWRKQHDATYLADKKEFLKLSDGDWTIDEEQSNIQGMDQTPGAQAAPQIRQGGADNLPGGGIVGAQQVANPKPDPYTGPQFLLEEESDIARNLRRRAKWKQSRIPSLVTLSSVGLLGCITTAFAVSAFALPVVTQWITILGLALSYAIGNGSYRVWRERESRTAQAQVLDFYRRFYIHMCERREDLERIDLVRTLRRRVRAMRARIDDIETFLNNVQNSAISEAESVRDQLFDGPAGTRDIFIANGERLTKEGQHTLDNVFDKVEQSRKNHSLEDWHRTLDTMREELIRQLRQGRVSLLEMSERDVSEFLYGFTANIVDGYLTGPLAGSLVEIGAALNRPEIWREVLRRVKRPLYYANVGMREPQLMFVCGSAQDLKNSARYIPPEATRVHTTSSEWLMVVAYFRGGSPTAFDAKGLFPARSTKKSGGGAGGGGGPGVAAGAAAAAGVPTPNVGTPVPNP